MRVRRSSFILLSALLAVLIAAPALWAFPNPANGVRRYYYTNGRLHRENRFKNQLIVRKRVWNRKGKLLLDSRYRDGHPYLMRTFYENGRLRSEWSQKTGKMKFYDPQGHLKAVSDMPGINYKPQSHNPRFF